MSVNSKVSREKSNSFSEVDHIRSDSLESADNGGIWLSFKDSFKPAEQSRTLTSKDISEEEEAKLTDVERAALRSANSQLSRSLKSRHLQMIAIGSSIGTGLFVGSGGALRDGGSAGLIIAWTIISTGVFATVQGLGELSVALPVSGGFNIYATRFIEPAVGFAIGWNYFMQFFVLLPLELVAASITIKYWNSDLNSDIFVAIFWVSVVFITMLGVKGYGEAEFVFSLVKVIAVIGV